MAGRGFQESGVGNFLSQRLILGVESDFVHRFIESLESFNLGTDIEAPGDRRVGLNQLERATSAGFKCPHVQTIFGHGV